MKKIVILLLGIIFSSLSLFGFEINAGVEAYQKGDHTKASELLFNTCNEGNYFDCTLLGEMYSNGQGVKQDYFKAIELYKKACDGGYNKSCFNLGISYFNGEGAKQDTPKAKELFGKACDGGYQDGCKFK